MDNNKGFTQIIANELGINAGQVAQTIALIDSGGTVPFIARYRKEATGSLDEVAIMQIRDRNTQLNELHKRKKAILKSIDEQNKLDKPLRDAIEEAMTLTEIEDIYLPYKPKRKTRASIAREQGLAPFANLILAQSNVNLSEKATAFLNPDKGVIQIEDVLKGARDIIAETINEDQETRKQLRRLFAREAFITSKVMKGKEVEGTKFRDYFDWREPLAKVPSHRMLAIRRGEKEMILSVDIKPEEASAIQILVKRFVKNPNESGAQVRLAIADAYKRLLKPSLETEARLMSKDKADKAAIMVFAENLTKLLLSAPLGQKNVLAIDPGFRTGCKIVCLNPQGKLVYHDTIYPHEPKRQTAIAGAKIQKLCKAHNIEAIAIGNGTAGRETENFIKQIGLPSSIQIVMVSESGASIYSASEVARKEFPKEDITVRGSVSIGRRLMDPLSELVKLDPKSIGVGQYQHDVDQKALKESLVDVVASCVNSVGVEVNSASAELLSFVAGVGQQLANNIVEFRDDNGPFSSRSGLKKVARFSNKVFEQAAGFLRISDADNPLDKSAVHPERYAIVATMAKNVGCSISQLINEPLKREAVNLKTYVSEDVGMPTLADIMVELERPGRDPREKFESFSFADDVQHPKDLKTGMVLPGLVTNVTNFGAFVDIGVHQDGLVHISHLADGFVSDPAKIVAIQQQVTVTVLEVDLERKRISLSMKSEPFGQQQSKSKQGKKAATKFNKSDRKEQKENLQDKLEQLKNKFSK